MGLAPPTRFVARGDGHIAYQVFGGGPAQILMVGGLASNVEVQWQIPPAIYALERLGQLGHVAVYDARGYGMSDRLPDGYDITDLAADALAVCDAAGFERPTVWGEAGAAAVAVWLAVHVPERVRSLVIEGGSACRRWHPDYPIGLRDDEVAERRELWASMWGSGFSAAIFAPGHADDERFIEDVARFEVAAATPTSVLGQFDLTMSLDVRDLLPKVTQPTFVFHTASNGLTAVTQGRYLAEHIPNARYLELDEIDATDAMKNSELLGMLSEFLTGDRNAIHVQHEFTVILFTDIADSTNRAMVLGDHDWRDLLAEFPFSIKSILDRYGATQVNTRGDDVLVIAATPSIAVGVARAIRDGATDLGLEVRSGVHLGEIERLDDDVAGIAVHIAARVAELAAGGEILVSQTMRDASIGSTIELHAKGSHHLKGIPGDWEVFAIT